MKINLLLVRRAGSGYQVFLPANADRTGPELPHMIGGNVTRGALHIAAHLGVFPREARIREIGNDSRHAYCACMLNPVEIAAVNAAHPNWDGWIDIQAAMQNGQYGPDLRVALRRLADHLAAEPSKQQRKRRAA